MTQLRRVLTLRDLVLFNLAAVISLRWLATSAKAGPAALVLWVLAALLFFVPIGLAVVELTRRFPEEGGLYTWTKRAMGEGHGFVCGWCYWISNVLYYPNLLMSTAVIATYAFGRGESGLASDWHYVLPATLGALWLAVGLNVIGTSRGRWLQNLGGIGTLLPGLLLIGFATITIARGEPSANPMTPGSLVPNLGDLSSLNLWASIAFAFTGLELAAALGGEVKRAEDLPRSVFLSAPIIALVYTLGTGALLWLMPLGELNIVSGLLQGIARGAREISPSLTWLVPLAALSVALGNLGNVGAWISGPARIAFVIGLDRYFPPAFGKVHPRWGTPYVAILVMAVLATVALLLSVLGRGTTVETVYLIMLDLQLLVYFVPFLYLFASLVIHRRREVAVAGTRRGMTSALLVAGSGGFVTLFAMVIATIPPTGTTHPVLFFVKVVGGAALFIGLGGWFYWRAHRRVVAVVSAD